jgi:hypothetical protein
MFPFFISFPLGMATVVDLEIDQRRASEAISNDLSILISIFHFHSTNNIVYVVNQYFRQL